MVHIGVLKVLEEAQIPIAAIAGTSSGSIMGAGYLQRPFGGGDGGDRPPLAL